MNTFADAAAGRGVRNLPDIGRSEVEKVFFYLSNIFPNKKHRQSLLFLPPLQALTMQKLSIVCHSRLSKNCKGFIL